MISICPDCRGRARIVVQGGPIACPLCRGRGSVDVRRDVIPLPVVEDRSLASAVVSPGLLLPAGARSPRPIPPEDPDRV
jgi:uncharacterized protein YbaR (Trm112 family)